jgi:hypothetical protein
MQPETETLRMRWRRPLALITLAGLALRLAVVFVAKADDELGLGDPGHYHGLANALRYGHGFAEPTILAAFGLELPTATHPPLYSIVLAAFSFLGFGSALGHRIVSCVIGARVLV